MRGVLQKPEQSIRVLPIDRRWWLKFDLLTTLTQRDLEARYKGSMMGNLWPLINQLSQLFIYTYVFSIVLKVKLSLDGLPENNFTFGLWLFAGLLPWMAFTTGFLQASNSVIAQPNLVKKVVFPLGLLPIVPVMSSLIESSLGMMALVVAVAWSSGTIHNTLWLMPLVWLPQFFFTSGLGYMAAALTVFVRDIPQTIGVIVNLWFYLTPIVYPASVIPEPFHSWVFWLNPMATLSTVYRDLILVGKVEHGKEWAVASLISVLVFWAGFWCYKRLRPAFADVL
jgi:lipopolysaccharide transport system permease protein